VTGVEGPNTTGDQNILIGLENQRQKHDNKTYPSLQLKKKRENSGIDREGFDVCPKGRPTGLRVGSIKKKSPPHKHTSRTRKRKEEDYSWQKENKKRGLI